MDRVGRDRYRSPDLGEGGREPTPFKVRNVSYADFLDRESAWNYRDLRVAGAKRAPGELAPKPLRRPASPGHASPGTRQS
jgi:hypothetical protein